MCLLRWRSCNSSKFVKVCVICVNCVRPLWNHVPPEELHRSCREVAEELQRSCIEVAERLRPLLGGLRWP